MPGIEHDPESVGLDTGDTGFTGAGCALTTLPDGLQLPDLPELYTIWDARKAWGTPLMVDTLTIAAEEMRWHFPQGDPLMIGDLSRRGGGQMRGHRSHRGGLDADVGIYWGDANQYSHGLRTVPAGELDLAANLAFVRTLFGSGNVERILLDNRIIRVLRAYAIDSGEMTEDEARAMFLLPEDGIETSPWNLDQVVHHVPGHHHHFHIRVRCSD